MQLLIQRLSVAVKAPGPRALHQRVGTIGAAGIGLQALAGWMDDQVHVFHRHRAGQHAGVMPAFGRQVGGFAAGVDCGLGLARGWSCWWRWAQGKAQLFDGLSPMRLPLRRCSTAAGLALMRWMQKLVPRRIQEPILSRC